MPKLKGWLFATAVLMLILALAGCGKGPLTTRELDTEKIAVNFHKEVERCQFR